MKLTIGGMFISTISWAIYFGMCLAMILTGPRIEPMVLVGMILGLMMLVLFAVMTWILIQSERGLL